MPTLDRPLARARRVYTGIECTVEPGVSGDRLYTDLFVYIFRSGETESNSISRRGKLSWPLETAPHDGKIDSPTYNHVNVPVRLFQCNSGL